MNVSVRVLEMKCQCKHDKMLHDNICTFSDRGECSVSGCLCTEYRVPKIFQTFNRLGGTEDDYKK